MNISDPQVRELLASEASFRGSINRLIPVFEALSIRANKMKETKESRTIKNWFFSLVGFTKACRDEDRLDGVGLAQFAHIVPALLPAIDAVVKFMEKLEAEEAQGA